MLKVFCSERISKSSIETHGVYTTCSLHQNPRDEETGARPGERQGPYRIVGLSDQEAKVLVGGGKGVMH